MDASRFPPRETLSGATLSSEGRAMNDTLIVAVIVIFAIAVIYYVLPRRTK